jgi:predicted acyl esterase
MIIGPPLYLDRPLYQLQHEAVRWFDHWIKGVNTGIMDEPPILYYRMVDYATRSGDWRYADRWPLPDVEKKTLFLHSNGTLSTDFPSHKEASPDL